MLFKGERKFSFKDVFLTPGQAPMSLPDVLFTNEAYGPVHAILCWDKKYKEPLYLVTNVQSVQDACNWYKKRFRIETFFSDEKSRGFYPNKSHLSDPKRLSRLTIAAWSPDAVPPSPILALIQAAAYFPRCVLSGPLANKI